MLGTPRHSFARRSASLCSFREREIKSEGQMCICLMRLGPSVFSAQQRQSPTIRSYLINTPAVFWAFAKRLEISIERLTGIRIANI